jgi:putative acetyltransferase
MDLRLARPADRPAVRDLHLAAFGEHGSVVADLVDDLRELVTAGCGLSMVAQHAGRVVGHVMFTPALLDAPRQLVLVQVLSPLAVVPEFAGQGIGSALVRAGVQMVDEQRPPVVFLEGDPAYYGRFGFEAGREQGFRRPSLRIPEEAFQARRLATYEPWMTGTLVYPAAFWDHDAVGLRDAELVAGHEIVNR